MFFEMTESVLTRDEDIVQQQTRLFTLCLGPRFRIQLAPIFRIRLAERREKREEEEHRQLQSIIRFPETQKQTL